jgi:tetratricopeptide (TPR) repeat protein
MKTTTLMKKLSLIILICLISPLLRAQSLQDGIKALNYGMNEKARNIFNSLIKADNKNAQAYYYLGQAYSDAELFDSARHFYNLGIAANSAEPLNYVGLGRTQMEDGKTADAKANFDKAISLSKNKDAKVLIAVAEANVSETNKNPDFAVQTATAAKNLDPKNIETLMTLGDALLEKDGGQALTQYEAARDLKKDDPRIYFKIGKLYNRARNTEEAQTNFQKSISLAPDFAFAYRELGTMFSRASKYTDAADYFKKYIALAGNSISERIRYATFLFLNKDYQGVINEINDVRKRDTSNSGILRLLGYSYYELGDYKKAQNSMLSYFGKMAAKKTIASDYDYMGRTYDKLGNDSLSVFNFKKALELDTNRTDLYGTLADKYTRLKKYKEAAFYINEKFAHGKGTTNDRYELGKAYFNSKEYVLADSQFAKVNRAVPANAAVYLWRARTYANLDPDSKRGLAKPYYEQFIEKANSDIVKYKDEMVEAYNYLAYYNYVQKEFTASKLYCEKVIAIEPKNSQAAKLLKYYNDVAKAKKVGDGKK